MRCIEIYITSASDFSFIRLTLTWDVLKFAVICNSSDNRIWININMRCIEMHRMRVLYLNDMRLTLTWDVLK